MANYLNKAGLTVVLKNIKNYIDSKKQDTLISGIDGNIKTIDNQSILRLSSSDGTNISTFTQVVDHGTNDTTFSLTPQVYHVWSDVSSLNLSLSSADEGYLDEYMFQFTSPSNAQASISLPQNVQWVHTPVFEAGKTYYVHIVNGLASYYTNNMVRGEQNIIEAISLNGAGLAVSNKTVDIELKTINNMPIYGAGNISLSYEPDNELLTTSYNPVQNAVVTIALEEMSHVTAAALTDLNTRMPSYVGDLINDVGYISYNAVTTYENDPVFRDSPAYSIESTTITYWNEKQPANVKISLSYSNGTYSSDIDSFELIQQYIDENREVYVEYDNCIYRYEKFENGQYNFIYLDTDEDNAIRLFYVWDSDGNDTPEWAYQEHVFIPKKTSDLTNDSGFINTVDTELSTTSNNPVRNSVITKAIQDNEYVVATSLNDLNSRMPEYLSDLTNDVGYISAETDPVFVASAAHDITSTDISNWNNKQAALVSGTNIKTINNESLLGEGNITIEAGSGGEANVIETVKVNGTALTPDANKAVNITVPVAVTESTVSGWGFTKNTGTITGITMNGASKGTSGVVDLGTVLAEHQDISGKADKSAAIGSLSLSLDSTNYKITLSGTKVDGTTFTVQNVIDLPLESVVVNGSYNNTTKKVVLTLQNGSTVDFSVADLVNGLQSEITSTNKLSADLIADGTTNKTVTATEKTTWNNKQSALSNASVLSGITSTKVSNWDTASSNSHTHSNKTTLDGITSTKVSNWDAASTNSHTHSNKSVLDNITSADITNWNGKANSADLATVATSGSYNDLSNKPTIPTVNNNTITLTFNGATVGTFTLNQNTNKTIDIGTIIGLPSFSAENNGQILGVVNGALAWITPTTIYTGSGTPSSSTGNNGDIYLQTR